MDPYQALGVERDASPEAIKQAHRRGVQQHHPDKGGERDAFEQVQRAYVILSDPERRQRYDETGDDGSVRPPTELEEVAHLVLGAFDRAIAQSASFKRIDIIKKMVNLLQQDRSKGEVANQQVANAKSDMKEMRRRLGFTGEGHNLIDATLAQRIAEADRQTDLNIAVMAKLDRAVEHVQLYGWEVDPVEEKKSVNGWFDVDAAFPNINFTDVGA